jgi:hypothetical protein
MESELVVARAKGRGKLGVTANGHGVFWRVVKKMF